MARLTPSASLRETGPVQITPRTLDDLGFSEVLNALARRCRTEPGRERALKRPFLDSAEEVSDALTRVCEARALGQEQLSLPFGGVSDLRGPLERASKGGLLEPKELVAAAQLLFAFVRTREPLEERDERLPSLILLARRLPRLENLAQRIDRCFEPDGEISDRASPALKEARDRARGLHRSIKGKLDALLHDEAFLPKLRETYYTLRNGRYVLPVLASNRSEVPGIVHNASQTGQTLFVEPQALIGLGNDLAIAQSLVMEEERRLLQELTDQLGRESARILDGIDALAELDEAEAAAVLASDLNALSPDFRKGELLSLRAVRHPLLVLKGGEVVANDVSLSEEARALVISGPNAGGKTVTLTAVGLSALMLRAGLQIPVEAGSVMPLYTSVHSTIGDAQDLSQGLSTFSAHLGVLREIVQSVAPGALVLIDEIAADTDPREGAAIAVAVLEELIERGAVVLVTTHLEELKALAHLDPRFLNARVGFDPRKRVPTYKLQLGAAGASSAIDVAARMGLPQRICERARELSLNAGGPLAKALASAEHERRLLAEELDRAEAATREAAQLRARLDEERQRFERERRQRQLEHHEALEAAASRAAEEVRELLQTLRAESNEKAATKARATLLERAEADRQKALAARAELHQVEAPGPATLKVGGWVHHAGLDKDVEILELTDGQALVAAGIMKMRVPLSELSGSRKKKPASKFPERHKQEEQLRRAVQAAPAEVQASSFRCDVRGMRADEALTEVDQFLDRGLRGGEEVGLIVHGHGTGALKQAIREHLSASPYVRMYRPGASHEGGDGVTVVAMRA